MEVIGNFTRVNTEDSEFESRQVQTAKPSRESSVLLFILLGDEGQDDAEGEVVLLECWWKEAEILDDAAAGGRTTEAGHGPVMLVHGGRVVPEDFFARSEIAKGNELEISETAVG